jgi:hypothetical protein
VQTPATHVSPPAHTVAQSPQWLALVVVSVSQPFSRLPSQLPSPTLHPQWMPTLVTAALEMVPVPLETVHVSVGGLEKTVTA